jgi:hypothetical protein
MGVACMTAAGKSGLDFYEGKLLRRHASRVCGNANNLDVVRLTSTTQVNRSVAGTGSNPW